MNYFTLVETPDKCVTYSPHTKIIVIDLNLIDTSECRSPPCKTSCATEHLAVF